MTDISGCNPVRRLRAEDLKAGKTLPGHILDDHGRIVLREGETLDEARCESLRKRMILGLSVGHGWDEPEPQDIDASGVLSENDAKQLTGGGGAEDRCGKRNTCTLPIMLHICDPGRTSVRSVRAICTDVSKGGMACIIEGYLHIGATVKTTFSQLENQPTIDGIVRSCHLLEGLKHRVGVQFLARRAGKAA